MPDALTISFDLDHPVYDCCYLALTRRLGSTLVTADKRLIGKVRSAAPEFSLILLNDWAPR